jgi:hypothetical protein
MTVPRLIAIAIIFLFTTLAWFILGASVNVRTEELDPRLHGEVEKLWGGRHVQQAPTAWYETTRVVPREVKEIDATGAQITKTIQDTIVDKNPVPVIHSRIDVAFALDQRQKGLLWYATYAVAFTAHYAVANPDREPRRINVHFAFPSKEAIYDGFQFDVAGRAATAATDLSAGVTTTIDLAPGATVPIDLHYQSRGLDDWHYSFGDGVAQIGDFELVAHTDFAAIDYPARSLSPTARASDGDGWKLTWQFASLVTGRDIGLVPPSRTNPGPLAARIAFFAPVGLLFFVTVMVILGILRGRSMHPMNYFFVSSGFFAFHLLLAYLVDHVDVKIAFAIAAAVSLALVASYLRLVATRRILVIEAAVAQLMFLVLFSFAFFFEGYTGLTVTVGAVLTLFVLMQLTGGVDWSTAFARKPPGAT